MAVQYHLLSFIYPSVVLVLTDLFYVVLHTHDGLLACNMVVLQACYLVRHFVMNLFGLFFLQKDLLACYLGNYLFICLVCQFISSSVLYTK